MIWKIELKNFKTFKDLPPLELKPITVLCGPNSGGKTTILQSILLCKQSISSRYLDQPFILRGDYTNLGNWQDLKFMHAAKKENIGFSWEINAKEDDLKPPKIRIRAFNRYNLNALNCKIKADYRMNSRKKQIELFYLLFKDFSRTNSSFELISKENKMFLKIDEGLLFLTQQIAYIVEDSKKEEWLEFIHPILEEKIEFEIDKILARRILPSSLHLKNPDELIEYTITMIKKLSNRMNKEQKLLYSHVLNLLERIYDSERLLRDPGRLILTRIPAYNTFKQLLEYLWKTIRYIGPIRDPPKRYYPFEEFGKFEIGNKGEYAPQILVQEQGKSIPPFKMIKANSETFRVSEIGTRSLLGALNLWLDYMDIERIEPYVYQKPFELYDIRVVYENYDVSIADVGFGFSQILPILIEGLRTPKGKTLILEQPEIHLHPKLQLGLADFLISMALSERNFIVETHSDHIVNRLVRRIIEDGTHEDKQEGLKGLISIYFVTRSEEEGEGSEIELINIDEKGFITNWPKGFFDQAAEEQQKIIEAGIRAREIMRNKKEN